MNNLITNIETNHNNSISNELATSRSEQNENEIIEEISSETSEYEDHREDFEVLVDFSNSSPIDLTTENGRKNSRHPFSAICVLLLR